MVTICANYWFIFQILILPRGKILNLIILTKFSQPLEKTSVGLGKIIG